MLSGQNSGNKKPSSFSEALSARRPISKKAFLPFYFFTFLPLIHFRAPCIPATSKLPGYVARLVVNPVFLP
jgi:hypothetical protein